MKLQVVAKRVSDSYMTRSSIQELLVKVVLVCVATKVSNILHIMVETAVVGVILLMRGLCMIPPSLEAHAILNLKLASRMSPVMCRFEDPVNCLLIVIPR